MLCIIFDVNGSDVFKNCLCRKIMPRLNERKIKHTRIRSIEELHVWYEFGEQIGAGSFGTVISVKDKNTHTNWAVKIISKMNVGTKMKLIRREIEILKMVSHPHIILLDKIFESNKKIFLVLELCCGELAQVYQKSKPFSENDTKKIITDLVDAVSYLHKHDIVHRDLKLENILLAENPRNSEDTLFIKVSDFGLSVVKSGYGYEDMLHDCCGTLTYMSPEMITNHSYSQQTDIWAIGVITYMLLTGKFPFYSLNEHELKNMICVNTPSFGDFRASDEAKHLIMKMLEKNPALRITAAEIAQHSWINGKSIRSSPNNVLDMMRMWRAEMRLPVGEASDWERAKNEAENKSNPDLPNWSVIPSLQKQSATTVALLTRDIDKQENNSGSPKRQAGPRNAYTPSTSKSNKDKSDKSEQHLQKHKKTTKKNI